MRFYTKQYKFYCGIDLHAKSMHLVHKRSELLAHIQKTTCQYNLPEIDKKIS